jgi:hypothetical protein
MINNFETPKNCYHRSSPEGGFRRCVLRSKLPCFWNIRRQESYIRIFSIGTGAYANAADWNPRDDDRRRVNSWIPGYRIRQGTCSFIKVRQRSVRIKNNAQNECMYKTDYGRKSGESEREDGQMGVTKPCAVSIIFCVYRHGILPSLIAGEQQQLLMIFDWFLL